MGLSDCNTSAMAKMLEMEFSNGLLDQGQWDKVVFHLLALEAYRHTVLADHPDHPDHSEHNFSQGCKLTTPSWSFSPKTLPAGSRVAFPTTSKAIKPLWKCSKA